MTRIFLTGATGYIGGDALQLLAEKHPDYEISVLVRDAEKASKVTELVKDVRVVLGDLDDDRLIEQEAAAAHIILNLASNAHMRSMQTIRAALFRRQEPVYWIQVSGATALAADEISDGGFEYGSASSTIFNDLDGVDAFRALLRRNKQRTTDNYVLDVAEEAQKTPALVHTALVYPPIIYGVGRGAVHQRSFQVPELARITLQRKRGLQVGQGLSRWGNLHIRDLSRLLVALTEAAASGKSSAAAWNVDGLYFTGVGEIPFGDISRRVASAAAEKGLIPDDSVEALESADANRILPSGTVLYGTNARSQARRGRDLLGWAPEEPSLEDDIARNVDYEAARLAD